MVVLARRFLNLIVPGGSPGVKLLRRIDLTRHHLFYGDASEKPTAIRGSMAAMETIQFADPSFTFRALNKDCFPLADYSECKLICADLSGRGFVFDLDSTMVSTIPTLRKLSVTHQHISVFVHKPHVDGNLGNDGNGSGLFIMAKAPHPEARRGGKSCVHESGQFVGVMIKHSSNVPGAGKSWHCRHLPPPPFVLETRAYSSNRTPEITAYGVVGGGGSHVCISVDGVGTYCLDTGSLTWSQAGEWTLPFRGKVEYVPALKLWFSFSTADADADAGRQHLAAADLSGMLMGSCSSSHPQRLVGGGPWQELVDLPEEWMECRDPQFVSLGSGRFCIARFFSQEAEADSDDDGEVVHKNFTVLTGVEVNNSSGTGKMELQMIPHKSRRVDNTSIETLF